MGYLSGDQNKINAYQSGDVYIYTAKLFNYVPEFATDETHPKERNIFKVLDLANNFGQGPMAVADQLKISVARAKTLQMKYRETFKTYFRWLEGYIEAGLRNGYLSTRFGWQRWIKDLFKIGPNGKAVDIRRSLMNWPIQAHGAEVLRKALIDLTDEHFEVCALVHDAILLQIPIPEFHERLEQAKRIMVNASIQVVGGPIQVEHETITGNYVQSKKDQKLFDEIMTEINSYTRSRNNLHPFQEHRPI
jgi:DNA polymerase I-like protein with 3'-5' exonuclease and polymerase domains